MSAIITQFFEASPDLLETKETRTKKKQKTGEDRSLLCGNCKYMVTSEDDRIIINESHMHTCKNPAGLIFTFGCFRDAPGCISSGQPSFDYTWFVNHSWQISICSNCGNHLGWLFSNSEKFFALIIDRLITR